MISTLKKKLSKKGFTLAELLVVVAIIAVLVAIAIPVFNSQLENARISTDQANIRSAYAIAQTATLLQDTSDPMKDSAGTALNKSTTYYFQKDGSFKATNANDYTMKHTSGNVTVDTVPGKQFGPEKKIAIKWETNHWEIQTDPAST